MPTPPTTCNAPVIVEVAFAVFRIVAVLPTYNAPPMPAPPTTCNAPVIVEVAELDPLTNS